MNWRGRPLTSHEVVVATIAATRTRTGLRVHAELDTGAYPLGIAVTRAAAGGRCRSRRTPSTGSGTTPSPPPADRSRPSTTHERTRARTAALHVLADQRLTGMSRDELAALAQALAPAQEAQAAQRRFEQRGGQRRRAPGAGSTGLLTRRRPGADHRRLPAPDLLPERAVRAAGDQREHHRPGDRRDPPAAQRTPPHDPADHAAVHHRRRADASSSPATSPSRRARACPTGSPIPP